MPYWIEQFNDPAASGKISLIVSILSVGTFVGALAAGLIADYTGRKWGIIICAAIPFNLGVILQVASTEQSMFIAGRFFAGLGVGLVSVQIPMYQAETLPKWIRGFIIGSYQLCITIGLLLASLINYGMSITLHLYLQVLTIFRHQGPQRQWLVPYPSRHPVRLVADSLHWNVLPPRNPSLPDQEEQARTG